MAPSFGTSGLRGLVTELNAALVSDYTRAFARACNLGTGLFVGRDLRASSPEISAYVIAAAREAGLDVTDCGAVPTPALALAAQAAGAGAVMVTGSHIPADRNGLKFYTILGEISKADEAAILAALGADAGSAASRSPLGILCAASDVSARYVARYVTAFGPQALAGLRLGVYQHSCVARDILVDLVRALGAEAVPLGRADSFLPVDTEAVGPKTRAVLAEWAAQHRLNAIWSSDGDADRPLLADAAGKIISGDILGVLTARALGADVVCAPVSCTSMVEDIADFRLVQRCKIGSPFVIAAMQAVLADNPSARVVGFEANGGFLLGYHAVGLKSASAATAAASLLMGGLPALLTRDAALPLIAPLAHARAIGCSLIDLTGALPAWVTAADRITDVAQTDSAAFLHSLSDIRTRTTLLAPFGALAAQDRTDGLRMTFTDGRILHLRASGNAPEFRIYVEAHDDAAAQSFLAAAVQTVMRAIAACAAHPSVVDLDEKGRAQ